MPYKVKDLTNTPNGWTGILEVWESCYCSMKEHPFTIVQEERPTRNEIIGILRK